MNWRAEWSGVVVVVVVAAFVVIVVVGGRLALTCPPPARLDPILAVIEVVAAPTGNSRVKSFTTSANIRVFLGLWATYLYFVQRRPTWTLGAPPGATCVVTQPLSASRGPTLVKFSVAPDKSTWL